MPLRVRQRLRLTVKMQNFSAEVWFEGDAFLEALFSDIKKAEYSVHATVYILKDDETGSEFLRLLAGKNAQGLDVRLMTDGIGSWDLGTYSLDKIRSTISRFHIFEPVSLLSLFSMSVNRRNHIKLFIIDRKIVYIGGMNIKNAISRRQSGNQAWIDCMIRIQGVSQGRAAGEIFERAWGRFYHGIRLPVSRSAGSVRSWLSRIRAVQVSEKPRGLFFDNIGLIQRLIHRRVFLQIIRKTEKNLYIETPYFVPGITMLAALRRAAAKGADVRLLLNSVSDAQAAMWAGRAVYSTLLKKGVRISERKEKFSHAKVLSSDGTTGIIGSSNMDYRSFFHNYEVDFLFNDPETVSVTDRRFLDEWNHAEEIQLTEWKARPMLNRIKEAFWYNIRWFL